MEKENFYLDDGRKAEKRVIGDVSENGESRTVVEIYAEPKTEKKLVQRFVDYSKPMVYKREIETIDESTGNIVEKKVESLTPEVEMALREHIKVESPTVASLSKKDDCDCYVTKEEMTQAFVEGFASIQKMLNSCADCGELKSNCHCKSVFKEVSVQDHKSVSAQNVLAEKVNSQTNSDWKNHLLWAGIAIVAAVLVFVVFKM